MSHVSEVPRGNTNPRNFLYVSAHTNCMNYWGFHATRAPYTQYIFYKSFLQENVTKVSCYRSSTQRITQTKNQYLQGFEVNLHITQKVP